MRVVAVDWSGRAAGERRHIWLAEVAAGRLRRLEAGRTREELVEAIVADAARDPNVAVGLDFAFSLPAWFLERQGISSPRELWRRLATEAEDWLREPPPPFWRAAGRVPAEGPELRRTELEQAAVAGIRPQSAFKLVGAGQVGKGSLRGMAALHRLVAGGFSVWPFDPKGLPVVVEIYPRVLTGPVRKSDARERLLYLERQPEVEPEQRALAAASEDAFDAAVSALVMWRHRAELAALEPEPEYALEGRIWTPDSGDGAI